jgi:hypothetical protein
MLLEDEMVGTSSVPMSAPVTGTFIDLTLDDSDSDDETEPDVDGLHLKRKLNEVNGSALGYALMNVMMMTLSTLDPSSIDSMLEQLVENLLAMHKSIVLKEKVIRVALSEPGLLDIGIDERILKGVGEWNISRIKVSREYRGLGIENAFLQGLLFVMANCFTDDTCSRNVVEILYTSDCIVYPISDWRININEYRATSPIYKAVMAIVQAREVVNQRYT